MKVLFLSISLFLAIALSAQPESGAYNYGKYDLGLTIEYGGKGDLRMGAKLGYRSFGGLFNRPINFSANVMSGLSTLKGGKDIGLDVGMYQVYADGNDFIPGFGIGTGLHLYYECDGPEEEKIRLQGMVNPGYYAFNYSLSLSARFDLLQKDLMADSEEDGKLKFFKGKSIGYMGDYQAPLLVGGVAYGYYALPDIKKPPEEEEEAADEEEEISFRPGAHLHLSF